MTLRHMTNNIRWRWLHSVKNRSPCILKLTDLAPWSTEARETFTTETAHSIVACSTIAAWLWYDC